MSGTGVISSLLLVTCYCWFTTFGDVLLLVRKIVFTLDNRFREIPGRKMHYSHEVKIDKRMKM
jgi:hypothetical protein